MLLRWIGFFFLTLVLGACASKGVDSNKEAAYMNSKVQVVLTSVTSGTIFSARPVMDSAGNNKGVELDVRKGTGEHIKVVQDADPSLRIGQEVKIVESAGKVHIEAMSQH